MRDESGGLRVTYFEGELEMMTPSTQHEAQKKRLARLLEAFAEECRIDLDGYGSWTVKKQEASSGAEADECYVIGPRDIDVLEAPDLAIEVVWTSGGIDKLAVWQALGVREVWFWQDGELRFFVLQADGYQQAERSTLLSGLDPDLLAEFMNSDMRQTAAVRSYREALRADSTY